MEPIRGRQVLLPIPPAVGFTVADLPALAEVIDASLELLDGEVIFRPLHPVWHDEAVSALQGVLLAAAPPGLAVVREIGIDLGGSMPVPDIAVVTRQAVTADSMVLPPSSMHLVVEVTSPSTRTRDRVLRPAQYAQASITCFWRADDQDGAIALQAFELLPDGSYAPAATHRDRITADRPFSIDTEIPEVTW